MMARQRYPNFRRAQQRRGPYFDGRRLPVRKTVGFVPLVAASSAAMFALVLLGDKLPGLLASAVQVWRNFGRDHAPPLGAYYSGCDAARAAGVAPIYSGEPGYRPEMDGDSDGVACEPFR